MAIRTSPALLCPCGWFWREIAYGNIVADIGNPGGPDTPVLRSRFVDEMTHCDVVSEVSDFNLPHPQAAHSCNRPSLIYWNWRGSPFIRSFDRPRGLTLNQSFLLTSLPSRTPP